MVIRVAIDCMGGDHGLPVTIPAAVNVAQRFPDTHFLLVGDAIAIGKSLEKYKLPPERYEIIAASEVVEMDDPIEVALRRKKDSSMRVALKAVKEGRADACISAGNTGALMAVSRYLLKTMTGIDRPAIATGIPNMRGFKTNVLDLGANIDCNAQNLLEFAIMGVAMAQALDGIDNPSVGLLNVGSEEIKGNETVKQAGELLRHSGLNFYGNVEGNDVFTGVTNVIVCDGFVGNSVLKAIEGLARMVSRTIRDEFTRDWKSKILALLSLRLFKRVRAKLDNRNYNGAMLLGLRGVVVKSHGSADVFAYTCALEYACQAVRNRMLEKIHDAVEQTHERIIQHQQSIESEPSQGNSPTTLATGFVSAVSSFSGD